ncbi:MAG: ATP-binding protein [Caldilineaceae bacterium]
MTSFVGREQEIAALQRLVQEYRLVTLTGVGGVGKSSLALALGQAILDFRFGILDLEASSPANNPKSQIP